MRTFLRSKDRPFDIAACATFTKNNASHSQLKLLISFCTVNRWIRTIQVSLLSEICKYSVCSRYLVARSCFSRIRSNRKISWDMDESVRPQSPISRPSLRLSVPSLRGLRVSGSRKVARPVRVPTEGRVCRHTFSRGRARCQGPSPTVMKRGNFGLINRLANVL